MRCVRVARPGAGYDVVYFFVATLSELKRDLPHARRAFRREGAIRISLYEKSAKIPTNVTENEVRNPNLKEDLMDVKVCVVTDHWSEFKLVARKHLR